MMIYSFYHMAKTTTNQKQIAAAAWLSTMWKVAHCRKAVVSNRQQRNLSQNPEGRNIAVEKW